MAGTRRMALRAQPDLFENAGGARCGILALDLRQHALLKIGILVRPHNGRPTRADGRLAIRTRFGDIALQLAGLGILQKSARRFDLLKQLPGFAGERIGENLQVIRAARRIHGAIQPRFLLQNQLGIARQALRGLVRLAIGFVERLDLQRIHAAGRRGHGFGSRAQQVHVRIVNGFSPARGARVDGHFRGAVVGILEARHRAGPHRAGGPQLGDFHEVVGSDGKGKCHGLRGMVRGESVIRELGHDLDSFGQREAEFLDDGRAGF